MRSATCCCSPAIWQLRFGLLRNIGCTSELPCHDYDANMDEQDTYKQRLELALEAAGLDLWENDLITGEVPYKAKKTFIELGYDEDEIAVYIDDLFQIIHPDDVEIVKTAVNNHLTGITPQYRCEFRIRAKYSAWVWYANYGRIMDSGDGSRGHRFIGVTFNIDDRKRKEEELDLINRKLAEEVAERKLAEQTARKLSRALMLSSQCNSVVVRADKEQELLTEICRLAVVTGGYLMAWVGYAENDAEKTVRPIAQSGFDQGYLGDVNITWAGSERGQGPAGMAIRESRTVPAQDLQSNPEMLPWREAATKRGYKSCIALPLIINKQVLGIFAIYSAEPSAFGKEEVKLLEEIASDLAYGIHSLRTRAEHAAAEDALKESMRQLAEKELAKTRFLAAAGHDLRQPLAAANLFIDALRFTEPTADQNQIIQRLDQAMTNFNGLLDALLNVSKLDAGIIKPEYTSINIIEIINWLEHSFTPMAREKQLGFKLYFPMKEALVIRSDIGLIKSVLMNLVSNAIKYTLKGSILISARRRGDDILFQVWDTGMGIEAENLKFIFDEFYQINNPQRDRTSGLGLGLAIGKRAIALLGREITCRSQIGRGSVFEFRLPLDNSQSEMRQQDATDVPLEEVNQNEFVRGKHFIVVEDDALIAEAMCRTLEMMGGAVEYFHSAGDALIYANIEHADYYIVDYMLGGTLNGIQLLNQLRQERGKHIHAVLMTGDTSPAFVRGVADCDWPVLHKPVNMSNLISALRTQRQ